MKQESRPASRHRRTPLLIDDQQFVWALAHLAPARRRLIERLIELLSRLPPADQDTICALIEFVLDLPTKSQR